MGKIPYFTSKQASLFNQIIGEKYIQDNFYFTGGTALSYFYLRHRYSEDFDFFSKQEIDIDKIQFLMSELGKKNNFTFTAQFKEVVYICQANYSDGVSIRIDFGHYPYDFVEKGRTYKYIYVDSLLDIAVNKITAIQRRTQSKDFVDLYFLLKKFTIWDLFEGVRIKHRMEIEPLLFAADLSVADDLITLPRMIKPLTLIQLKTFYKNLAYKLGKKEVI